MLAFLQEQEPGGVEREAPNVERDTKRDSRDTQAQEQEYLTVAAHGKNVRKTTCLLAVLFGIGLLCLWFMIKKSTPQTVSAALVSAEETQIELAFQRLAGVRSEMFSRMDEIVKKFYQFSDVQQVEVDELKKNPFKAEMFLGDLKEAGGLDVGDEIEAESLQLLSIMATDAGNCCMIDDKILYEGDSIGGFRVRQISDSFVKLEWTPKRPEMHLAGQSEGVEIVLKLLE